MRFPMICVALTVGLFASGCGPRHYDDVVRSARTALPVAVEMEKLFGTADHFLANFKDSSNAAGQTIMYADWVTTVYFGDRYEFRMRAKVEIDDDNRRLKPAEDPIFELFEIVRVTRSASGAISADFGPTITFYKDDWETLNKGDGDFSAIGIELNPEPVADFSEYAKASVKDHEPISLTK